MAVGTAEATVGTAEATVGTAEATVGTAEATVGTGGMPCKEEVSTVLPEGRRLAGRAYGRR